MNAAAQVPLQPTEHLFECNIMPYHATGKAFRSVALRLNANSHAACRNRSHPPLDCCVGRATAVHCTKSMGLESVPKSDSRGAGPCMHAEP